MHIYIYMYIHTCIAYDLVCRIANHIICYIARIGMPTVLPITIAGDRLQIFACALAAGLGTGGGAEFCGDGVAVVAVDMDFSSIHLPH